MHLLNFLVSASLALASILEPFGHHERCCDEPCYKALETGAAHHFDAKGDCKSYNQVMVTPCTKTVTKTQHRSTSTVTKTVTVKSSSHQAAQVTEKAYSQKDTEESQHHHHYHGKCPATHHPHHIPAYATKACGPHQYASACSCLGYPVKTTTKPQQTVTSTTTLCPTTTTVTTTITETPSPTTTPSCPAYNIIAYDLNNSPPVYLYPQKLPTDSSKFEYTYIGITDEASEAGIFTISQTGFVQDNLIFNWVSAVDQNQTYEVIEASTTTANHFDFQPMTCSIAQEVDGTPRQAKGNLQCSFNGNGISFALCQTPMNDAILVQTNTPFEIPCDMVSLAVVEITACAAPTCGYTLEVASAGSFETLVGSYIFASVDGDYPTIYDFAGFIDIEPLASIYTLSSFINSTIVDSATGFEWISVLGDDAFYVLEYNPPDINGGDIITCSVITLPGSKPTLSCTGILNDVPVPVYLFACDLGYGDYALLQNTLPTADFNGPCELLTINVNPTCPNESFSTAISATVKTSAIASSLATGKSSVPQSSSISLTTSTTRSGSATGSRSITGPTSTSSSTSIIKAHQ